MAKVKIYEIKGFNECMTQTVYCGVKVNLNFINGNMTQNKNARLKTSNPFAQDAIESDERFRQGAIVLVWEAEEENKATARDESAFKAFGKGKEASVKTQGTVAAAEAGVKETAETGTAAGETEVVEEVKDLNDLDAWFAERGVTLASSKKSYINDLCKEHGVKFPNLKLK